MIKTLQGIITEYNDSKEEIGKGKLSVYWGTYNNNTYIIVNLTINSEGIVNKEFSYEDIINWKMDKKEDNSYEMTLCVIKDKDIYRVLELVKEGQYTHRIFKKETK